MKLILSHFNRKSSWIILLICIAFFILRFPSLFEPNWYGDEGIYQSIGFGLRSGRDFYTGVWDNKPPLLFVIYAIAGGIQFNARLISLIFGIAAVISFYSLSRKIFIRQSLQFITTLFFAILFGLPIIEGNIANSENYMLFPIILSANILYPAFKRMDKTLIATNRTHLLLGGFILSLSFLIKIVSIFDFAALLTFSIFMLFYSRELSVKSVSNYVKNYMLIIVWFIIGFVFPVLITFVFFYFKGTLSLYLDAAFGRNVNYVGWANYFIIPQGLLYLRLIILVIFIILLFVKRRSIAKNFLFVLIWLAFSLFNAYFSNRGYTHYLLLVLPSFSLLIGFIFIKNTIIKKVLTILFTSIIFLILNFNFIHWNIGKTAAYYNNFLSLISGKIGYKTYQDFFDSRNYNDYLLVEYIKEHTEAHDVIFLWGNSAQVYPLSKTLPPGRYSAAYHITNSKENLIETERSLIKNKPKYIIITQDLNYYPFDLSKYLYKLTINDVHIYENNFK